MSRNGRDAGKRVPLLAYLFLLLLFYSKSYWGDSVNTDTWAFPCCGLDKRNEAITALVEGLRRSFPDLMVTSGTRCRDRNREVGGSPRSGHLPIYGPDEDESVAVDITLVRTWNEGSRRKLVYEAIALGAMGIGVYASHIHVDLKPRRQLWASKYGEKPNYFFT